MRTILTVRKNRLELRRDEVLSGIWSGPDEAVKDPGREVEECKGHLQAVLFSFLENPSGVRMR